MLVVPLIEVKIPPFWYRLGAKHQTVTFSCWYGTRIWGSASEVNFRDKISLYYARFRPYAAGFGTFTGKKAWTTPFLVPSNWVQTKIPDEHRDLIPLPGVQIYLSIGNPRTW